MSEKACELLKREIEKITAKGDLTQQSLENLYKLSKSLYYLSVTDAMEEEKEDGGYSERYMYDDMPDRNYSGRRNQRRDSMGRYSRNYAGDNYGSSSYNRGGNNRSGGRYYNDGGYSGHGDTEMMSTIEDMMQKASDPKEREVLQKMMDQIGQ